MTSTDTAFTGEYDNKVTTGSVTPLPADLVVAYGQMDLKRPE